MTTRMEQLESQSNHRLHKRIKIDQKLKKQLPGSSQPQDLGSISYKDTETNETSQKIQSVETTSSIITETFEADQYLLPNDTPEKQYQFAYS